MFATALADAASNALAWLLSHPQEVVTALTAALVFFKGSAWVDAKRAQLQAFSKSDRAAAIRRYATLAFHAVEELAALDPAKFANAEAKIAKYLEALNSFLVAAGLDPLTADELKAEAQFASPALNALAKLADAKAAPAAAPAPAASPANPS